MSDRFYDVTAVVRIQVLATSAEEAQDEVEGQLRRIEGLQDIEGIGVEGEITIPNEVDGI